MKFGTPGQKSISVLGEPNIITHTDRPLISKRPTMLLLEVDDASLVSDFYFNAPWLAPFRRLRVSKPSP